MSDRAALKQAGFTLLEMLVVMVILGMLTSVALPRMQRWHDAVQARAQGAVLLDSVRAAAFAAGARRMPLRLTAKSFNAQAEPGTKDSAIGLELPTGWRVIRVDDATFLANGLCRPGAAVLHTDRGVAVALRVEGPKCSVSLTTLEGGV